VGGQYHKMITMKPLKAGWILVDDVDNSVGMIRTDSLAKVDKKKYPVEGYLNGALDTDSGNIYLWFSTGTVLLIDGLTFNVKS